MLQERLHYQHMSCQGYHHDQKHVSKTVEHGSQRSEGNAVQGSQGVHCCTGA